MVKSSSGAELRARLHAFGLARDRLLIGLARRERLSQLDLHALEHLEAAGPLTPRDLERRLGLTSGAITALIDRLERAGWVGRTPHPDDRRSVLVDLSAAAHDAGDERLGGYHRAVARAIERLSAPEHEMVSRFLDEVTRAAREQGDRLWDAGRAAR